MVKFCTLLLISIIGFGGVAQDISYVPTIEKHVNKDEFRITAQFNGLDAADFAKIKFSFEDEMNASVPPNGSITSSMKDNVLSFYAYSLKDDGVIQAVFAVSPVGGLLSEKKINVMLQYAVGDEREDVLFDPIILSKEMECGGFDEDYSAYVVEKTESTTSDVAAVTEKSEKSHSGNPVSEKTSFAEGTYTVQILSLSNYSESRIKKFCTEHNIKKSDLLKREKGGAIKVSLGNSLSMSEAQALKRKIIDENGVEGAFVVKID